MLKVILLAKFCTQCTKYVDLIEIRPQVHGVAMRLRSEKIN